jgi:hypothetical protein
VSAFNQFKLSRVRIDEVHGESRLAYATRDSRKETADSRLQAAGSRQQAADSRQQVYQADGECGLADASPAQDHELVLQGLAVSHGNGQGLRGEEGGRGEGEGPERGEGRIFRMKPSRPIEGSHRERTRLRKVI